MNHRVDNPSSKSIYVFFFFLFCKNIASHHASNHVICCINLVMSIIIQMHILIQVDSVILDMNGFINFWLRSIDMRRETQIIKAYANHTMLTPLPMRGASCGVWDLSSSLQKNSTVDLSHCFFKILKFSGPSLLGMMLSTLHFLSGVYWHDDCRIFFAWA